MEVERTFYLVWQHLAAQERVLEDAIKVMMLFTPVVFKVSLPGLPLPDFPLSPMYAPGPRSRALGTGPGAKWALTDRGGRSGERGHYVRVRLRRRRGPNLGAKTDGRRTDGHTNTQHTNGRENRQTSGLESSVPRSRFLLSWVPLAKS